MRIARTFPKNVSRSSSTAKTTLHNAYTESPNYGAYVAPTAEQQAVIDRVHASVSEWHAKEQARLSSPEHLAQVEKAEAKRKAERDFERRQARQARNLNKTRLGVPAEVEALLDQLLTACPYMVDLAGGLGSKTIRFTPIKDAGGLPFAYEYKRKHIGDYVFEYDDRHAGHFNLVFPNNYPMSVNTALIKIKCNYGCEFEFDYRPKS